VDDLQSEKEQIEEMRAWWVEYRLYIIAGVLVAISMLVGFNQYKSNKLAAEVAASELFESLAADVFDGNLDEAERVADELVSNFANTSYAAQSRLAMARLYMDKNRDQDAADVLNDLIVMRGNTALKNVGRLRLARVLLYQDKEQEVIDLLAGQDSTAFAGLYAEMRGDAFAALGEVTAASDEYRIALADTSQTVNRGLVQMKLIDLPEAAPAEPEPEAATEPEVATESEAVIEPDVEPILDDASGESE
jgi:predicted negative regulator of RcsB-dependent stress response